MILSGFFFGIIIIKQKQEKRKHKTQTQACLKQFPSEDTPLILFLSYPTNVTGLESNFMYFEDWY